MVRIQTPDEQRPASRLLGDELRFHRERLGYTLADAAQRIRASTSKISRLERGESPAKPRDVYELAEFYGLSREQRSQLDQLLAQTGNADTYARFADVTPNYLRRLIRLEGHAQKISVFEPRVVPGLLQTEAYADAIVRLTEAHLSDSAIKRIVELRMQRQLLLTQGGPLLDALISEDVLRRLFGDPCVMVDQMEYLLHATQSKGINVRVVRAAAMVSPYPIYHLTFADVDSQELAYVEHLDGAHYVTQKQQLDKYRRLLVHARANALGREDSIRVLTELRNHWEKQGDGGRSA
ncbi:helix-turn-helix domain-containing protein [Streptomyces antimicrobicus]|uniref:Helix-turn-helix domain-containing protein n=1 Tax=Streptomyces antimicrobicus TaxID=2883108 RepID=A0ABS8BEJ9_9ACTN|nr:helix-turn-helix transcriptional regulator [Streptomyces antimicrobicus]MCB5183045.1 helix-turn-helix domain-containing protein [Streptomyces antimicrobicus]